MKTLLLLDFLQPKLMSGGNYIKEGRDSAKSTCLIFSPKEEDEVGALGRYLQLFAVSKETGIIILEVIFCKFEDETCLKLAVIKDFE